MLQIELKRAFKRKTFLISLLVVTLLCIVDNVVSNYNWIIMPYNSYPYFFEDYIKLGIVTSYQCFTFFHFTPLASILFTLMPILVAISYSDSYLEDLNSGFLKNILARCSKRKYLQSKFLANFIISGITVSIPLLINLLILITTQSSIKPEKMSTTTLLNGSLNLDMYLNHPMLYTLMWIFIFFIFAGVISSIALSFSIVIRNKFIVLIAPFITVQAIGILFSFIGLNDYSVLRFLYLYSEANPIAMMVTFIVMLAATFLSFYFGGKSNETF